MFICFSAGLGLFQFVKERVVISIFNPDAKRLAHAKTKLTLCVSL